ncbi:free fatty acid receptor 2-like [Bombina bombina]|uniref:free fatty acid receptor 2-like n=1 Tax=Bombina bombina TaxID=8345 RepID=UPI00235AD437|nr:free fatty acid receptor 2-like [Bombina bombina]
MHKKACKHFADDKQTNDMVYWNHVLWSLLDTKEHSQLVLSVYILTFITGLPTNILAFYTFMIRVRKNPTPIDILLLNLTISDLLLLLFLPFKMFEAASGMQWNLPFFMCSLTGFCYYSSIYISTMFLTAVSVERYLGVAYPIKYKLNRKPQYAMVASVIFWFLACSHCSIVYIVQYRVSTNLTLQTNSCYEQFSPDQLEVLLPVRLEMGITMFFLPFIITLYCYINFIRILMSLPNIPAKRKQRAIGLAVATLSCFVICFAPYNISHLVGFVQNESPRWRVDALLLSTFNASLDPVVFYFSSTAVQKTFLDIFAAISKKLKTICPCQQSCHFTSEMSSRENTMDRSST